MNRYYCFGLRLQSAIELPDLSPDDTSEPADVAIDLLAPITPATSTAPSFAFSEHTQIFTYPGVGQFEILGNERITVRPEFGVPHDLLSFALLGPVMALLLHLRARFVLHASAVNFDFGAAVFMGDKGAGKSTLAASLLSQPGASLLSDDLVVFDDHQGILPGYPQMKVDAQLAQMLSGLNAINRPVDAPWFPKTRMRLRQETARRSFPISAIYELRRDTEFRTEPMSQLDAVRAAYRFAYFIRYGTRERSVSENERLFRAVSQIARNVPFRRLFVPSEITELAGAYSALRVDALEGK